MMAMIIAKNDGKDDSSRTMMVTVMMVEMTMMRMNGDGGRDNSEDNKSGVDDSCKRNKIFILNIINIKIKLQA